MPAQYANLFHEPLTGSSVFGLPRSRDKYIQVGLDLSDSKWVYHINHRKRRGKACFILGKITLHEMFRRFVDEMIQLVRSTDLPVYVVYEVGPYGHDLGRRLLAAGICPVCIVPGQIEYVRMKNRQKSEWKYDRFDAKRLSMIELADPDLPWVDIPSSREENCRSLLKQRNELQRFWHSLNSRLCAILRLNFQHHRHKCQALWLQDVIPGLGTNISLIDLDRMQGLLTDLGRVEQYQKQVDEKLRQQEQQQRQEFAPPAPEPQPPQPGRHALQGLGKDSPLLHLPLLDALQRLFGIGEISARALAWSIGDLRRFHSGKALRKFLGMAPLTRESGFRRRSGGMADGDPELRRLMIELAWNWLTHQPESRLTKKYQAKMDHASRRGRKIAICALAGEITEFLYRHLLEGKTMDGLRFKTAAGATPP